MVFPVIIPIHSEPFVCPACSGPVGESDQFCRRCGRKFSAADRAGMMSAGSKKAQLALMVGLVVLLVVGVVAFLVISK